MHRTQISLEEAQYERLAQEARRLRISLSELIRRLVSRYLDQQPAPEKALDQIAGIATGTGEAVGREHNRFLYGKKDP
jgi:metal-responsive CopG/Arc/MetJ family transcriptional regulator